MSAARVLLTKSFIDSHDRAIKTIAIALREAGMEAILVDYETPEQIVAAAIDEDVDVVGISFMSGGQVPVCEAVMAGLGAAGAAIPVVVGGTIRPFDEPALEAAGISRIVRGGEPLATVAAEFERLAGAKRATEGAR